MTTIIILAILNFFLLLVFTLFIILTIKERSSLLDRIMSRDYEQFKALDEPEANDVEPEDTNLIDITEARDEIGE